MILHDYRHIPARELDRLPPCGIVLALWCELHAEASRVGGLVRWHRAERRPVVAVKVAGRWCYRP